MSAEQHLRIGIVGLGSAGGRMVSAVAAHPLVRIAGAADLHPELRERFARDYNVEVHDDALPLMQRPDIDAVYIATPHQFHRAHAVMAAEHGKHVIVEKPMALSLEDCDAMIAAAEKHGTVLIVGHTHSFDPAVAKMRELIAGGELGRLAMIGMWNYTDFLYRPRRPEELDTSKGGGILFNQIPHQVDTARLLSGSPVRSVRAMTGVLDPRRPTEGACMAFLDFADGTAASITYSGYDHFDSDELHGWIGEAGQTKKAGHGSARKSLSAITNPADEAKARAARYGYGNAAATPRGTPAPETHQPHFGMLVVSCEHGDLRPSADGVLVYADDGLREIALPPAYSDPGRDATIDELHRAVTLGIKPIHDGNFAKGTVETCLAILRSARERREIVL
jgi:phthalate 4,5-cis-dihydrodiol dehydrogenase